MSSTQVTPSATVFETIAREMRRVETGQGSKDLPGAEKKTLVINSLRDLGILPAADTDPARAQAEVAIDALIWAIRHKKELSIFLRKICCCCG